MSEQKQFRVALRKAMIAEDIPPGEQAKLELLFQSISLEKLEQLAAKLKNNWKVKFNKPKVRLQRLSWLFIWLFQGIEENTFHINKKEIDSLITQQMLKCLEI